MNETLSRYKNLTCFYSFLVVVDVLLAVALISLILINRGRGAEVGAAFGGGASSSSVFGSKGATPFITKVIATLAGLFLANSLGLAYLANFQYVQKSVIDEVNIETQQTEDRMDGKDDLPDEFDAETDIAPDVPN